MFMNLEQPCIYICPSKYIGHFAKECGLASYLNTSSREDMRVLVKLASYTYGSLNNAKWA